MIQVSPDELDRLPREILHELSRPVLAEFAAKMRGERNTARSWWKTATENLSKCRADLEAARGACKRMNDQLKDQRGRYEPS